MWWIAAGLLTGEAAHGQQGFGSTTTAPPLTGAPSLSPISPAPAPSSTLQTPTFDPYSTQPNSAFTAPSLTTPAPPSASFGTPAPAYSQPYSLPSPGAQPYYTPPATGFGAQSPPALFPFGLQGPGQPASGYASGSPLKFLQNVRLSDDFLCGDSTSSGDMRINDAFATTTIAFPNFFWTGQPWFLSPGFAYHAWSGPYGSWTAPAGWGAPAVSLDFPEEAFSGFLDVGWRSSPDRAFGAELGGRIGVYSDFSGVENESVRPMGLALLRYNLTPTIAVKGGVSYINRADIKLLPAIGILWTPNPKCKWDIFFPQPKLSSYLTTLGNYDLWWYVTGEYGGGVWTPKVAVRDAANPAIVLWQGRPLTDINDLRVSLGIEVGPPVTGGIGQRGLFFEVGYVFDRKVYMAVPTLPDLELSLNDTWMLRGGFAF